MKNMKYYTKFGITLLIKYNKLSKIMCNLSMPETLFMIQSSYIQEYRVKTFL